MITNILFFLCVLMLIPTLASLTTFDEWWIRAFDFPRIQISALILLVLVTTLFMSPFASMWHFVIKILLVLSLIYQVLKIFPYTPLAKKQVLSFKGDDPNAIISVLVSNVLTPNREYQRLINLVKKKAAGYSPNPGN